MTTEFELAGLPKVLGLVDGVCTLLVHYYRQPTY